MTVELLDRARAGEPGAFDALAAPALDRLRATVRRLVGDPDESEDVVQEALIRAFRSLGGFRGDAAFATWLCAIGTRAAVDHLRQRKRWRAEAQQLHAMACSEDEALSGALVSTTAAPDFAYDFREHVAYCFTCVGRSLPPDQQAAVVLRDVLGHTNAEAAGQLDMSVATFRHRLRAGRAELTTRFEGLCALVNKQGMCHQCAGLRMLAAEDRRGPVPEAIAGAAPADRLAARCQVVAAASLDGASRRLHDVMFQQTASLEREGWGDAQATVHCEVD